MKTYTDSDLRSLDIADPELSPKQQRRASDTLAGIMTMPTGTAPSQSREGQLEPTPRPRRHATRAALGLAAAAALATVAVILPGLGHTSTAYATWTAEPSPLAATDLTRVTQACRDKVGAGPQPDSYNPATVPVALTERRGDLVMILFHTNNPDISIDCVAINPPGSSEVDDINIGIGGGSGPARIPPANDFTQGSIGQYRQRPTVSVTDGAVGPNVAAVTIHSGNLTVNATVLNGRYAAWWPGPAFDPEPPNNTGPAGPRVNLRYDLTLIDGTTILNATPATVP